MVEAKASQYLKECVLTKMIPSKDVKAIITTANPVTNAPIAPVVEDLLEFDQLKVNFRPDLKDMIKETKFLEKMGFVLPETAINIALQEEKYMAYVEVLERMLHDYHQVLDTMDVAEKILLTSLIKEVKRIISPGLTRLNWNSLGITDYVARCNTEINRLSTIINHVQKNATAITGVVDELSRAILVKIERGREPMEANVIFLIMLGL